MANNLTLLIAPQWDGNQRVDVFINGELLTFNRTTVGWKPARGRFHQRGASNF